MTAKRNVFLAIMLAAAVALGAAGCPKKPQPQPAPAPGVPSSDAHKDIPEVPKIKLPMDYSDKVAARIKAQTTAQKERSFAEQFHILDLMLLRLHSGKEKDKFLIVKLVRDTKMYEAGTDREQSDSEARYENLIYYRASITLEDRPWPSPDGSPVLNPIKIADTDKTNLSVALDAYEASGDNKYISQAEAALNAVKTGTPAIEATKAIAYNRLYFYTGKADYRKNAAAILNNLAKANPPDKAPLNDAAAIAIAIELVGTFPLEMTVIGDKNSPKFKALLAAANAFFEPRKVILAIDPADPTDKKRLDTLPYSPKPEPTLFACVETACAIPTSDPAQVGKKMKLFVDNHLNKSATPGLEKNKL